MFTKKVNQAKEYIISNIHADTYNDYKNTYKRYKKNKY
jgi:hypothetical protein